MVVWLDGVSIWCFVLCFKMVFKYGVLAWCFVSGVLCMVFVCVVI